MIPTSGDARRPQAMNAAAFAHLVALRSTRRAAGEIVRHLAAVAGMQLWMVARVEGEDWIVLAAEDRGYGVAAGNVFAWSETICRLMVEGLGPTIAEDVGAVPAYTAAGIRRQLEIGAYAGVPIRGPEGEVWGTLCAVDPEPAEAGTLEQVLPTMELFASLLADVIDVELRALEEQRRAERAELAANEDTMTGVASRRLWERLVAAEESRCVRHELDAAVIVLDVDGLKLVNDRLGHDAGDELLRQVADTVRESVRGGDVVARLGGDEFGVLLPSTTAPELERAVERLRGNFAQRGLRASVGSASRREHGTIERAITAADDAMYADKRSRAAGP